MPRIFYGKRSINIKLPPEWEARDWEQEAMRAYPFDPLKSRLYNVFRNIALQTEKVTKGEEARPYLPADMPEWEFVGEKREASGKHIILARGKEWLCPCNQGDKCKGKENAK